MGFINSQRVLIAILAMMVLSACSTTPEPVIVPGPQSPGKPPVTRPGETPKPSTGPATDARFDKVLFICPGMTVSNAPLVDTNRKISDYRQFALIQGVWLAVNPAPGACMSSGVGLRDGRLHKGTDYHARPGVPVLAAARGTIVEMTYRSDYGNMMLIDHGGGVYTRYAHLAAFSDQAGLGRQVAVGEALGLMGNTAGYTIPIHLHYEVLTGDYHTSKGAFGLTAVNPFNVPSDE